MNQRAQIFFRACLHILLLLTSLTYWPHFHLLFKKDGLLLTVWENDCRQLQTPFFSQLTTLEGGKPLLILFIHMKSQQSPGVILCFLVYECARVHTFLFCFVSNIWLYSLKKRSVFTGQIYLPICWTQHVFTVCPCHCFGSSDLEIIWLINHMKMEQKDIEI